MIKDNESNADISSQAMLFTFKWSMTDGTRKNTKETDDLASLRGADPASVAVTNKLLTTDDTKLVRDARNAFTRAIKPLTLPWDKGARLLPIKLFQDAQKIVFTTKEKLQRAKLDMEQRYNEIRESAEQRLGKMYVDTDFPELDTLLSKFDFTAKFLPLPRGDAYRMEMVLSEQDLSQLRSECERDTRKQLEEAQATHLQELLTAIKHMAERIGKETKEIMGEEKECNKVFHDSTVYSLKEMLTLAHSMNFMEDETIKDAINECLELIDMESLTPKKLRRDEEARLKIKSGLQASANALMLAIGGN